MKKISGKTYWFELPVSNLESAKTFYSKVLGWTFQKLLQSEVLNYWMIGVDGELIGGLKKAKKNERSVEAPVIYFCVDHLGAKIKLAQTLGAQLEGGRIDLGLGRGCFQRLRDPDQNLIAFWANE
ncbi:MAG: VOC family protein [Nitrospiria bacterium]